MKESDSTTKLPIIYSPKYNISILGFENFHPFDTKKYKKVYSHLRKELDLSKNQFYTPFYATDSLLLTVHTEEYLQSLKKSSEVAMVAEMAIFARFPNWFLQKNILNPMRWATGGTVVGVDLALKEGWAINLSGGYHHAKAESSSGFCFYSDIALAAEHLWKSSPEAKVLILDLDAHQGNGFEAIFKDDNRITILDIYTEGIYPDDREVMKYIDYNVPIPAYTKDSLYLEMLERELCTILAKEEFDFIIYNAGTDILKGDHVGQLAITEEGIIERDAMVFSFAKEKKTPILMLLSGGYTKESGPIIGKSITHLVKSVLNVDL